MNSISLSEFPSVPDFVAETVEGRARIDFGFPLHVDADFWRNRSRQEAAVTRPREFIADRMLTLSGKLDLHEKARENIEALKDPTTLTVVTGQQVGLAGGPLLTLYKAITAVAFARKMEEESGIRTVPVFWMATSDHNLADAAQLHWINLENHLSGYKANQRENRVPVGRLTLGHLATDLLEALDRDLPDNDFKGVILEHLEASYRPEATFASAFHHLGNRLLGPYGMVMFDPEDEEIKRASAPFWEMAIENVDVRLKSLAARSKQIAAAEYPVQAPIGSGRPAIFLIEDGLRRKVVLEGRAIRARSDVILNREDLARIADERPEDLSAGVTLRPLLQGWLLPTATYVAGPHEMAYWSQLANEFEPLGLQNPSILPRASYTLIESKVRRRLNKFNLRPEELFGDVQQLTEHLMQGHRDRAMEDVFEKVETSIEEGESTLRRLTEQAEYGGLDNAVNSSFRKIQYHLEKLKNTFESRLLRQNGDVLAHMERLTTHLLPAGRPQERVITPMYYLARYGLQLLDVLRNNALDAAGRHAFLDLEEITV